MKKTTMFLALAASTAVLAACGSGESSSAPVAPVSAPSPATSAAAPSASAATGAPDSPALPAAVSDRGASVDADDQSGDGTTVVVRDARITAGPGWLAVRTGDDRDDRLLGSVPLQPGQAAPVTVTLTEPVPAGTDDDLTVVLHADDGDGVFDELRDPRVLDDDDDDGDRDDRDGDDVEDEDFDYRLS